MIGLLKSFFEKNVFPIRDKWINAPGGDRKLALPFLHHLEIKYFKKSFFCQILFCWVENYALTWNMRHLEHIKSQIVGKNALFEKGAWPQRRAHLGSSSFSIVANFCRWWGHYNKFIENVWWKRSCQTLLKMILLACFT